MDQPRTVRVRVPASSANLGPGFDALALALGLHLRCTLRASNGGLKIRVGGNDGSEIPCDESNLILKTFRSIAGAKGGTDLDLEIKNDLPLGRGLGSSAAAIVAGLALANEWEGLHRTRDDLVQLGTEIEGHPDNIAAAVHGGLVASCQQENGSVVSAKNPLDARLQIVLVVPDLRLSTEKARAALPESYSRRDAVFNVQRVALLLAACREGRREIFAEAMRDRLHQPYRAPLIPGLEEILNLPPMPSLLGVALSGAGPSVVAFCDGATDAIGETIAACFHKHGIGAKAQRLAVDYDGLVVTRE